MKIRVAVLLGASAMLAGLIGVALQTMHTQAGSEPTPITQPVRLFSLTYDNEPGQIEVTFPTGAEGEIGSGPSDFKVAWDGSAFYFANAGTNEKGKQQVKVFNRQGQLIRALASNLERLDWLAITPTGVIYLMTPQGDGAAFEVFSEQGQRQTEQARTLEAAVKGLDLGIHFFTTDVTGNLYTGIIMESDHRLRIVRITPTGQTKVLPGGAIDRQNGFIFQMELAQPAQSVTQEVYGYGEDGTLTLFHRSEEPTFTPLNVIVTDIEGKELRRFRVPAGDLDLVEQSLCISLEPDKVDGRGHLYIVGEPRQLRWVKVGDGLEVLRYFVVMEYDGQGNRIGVRAVYSEPNYGTGRLRQIWDVDKDGNVYYLDFKSDRLDVMMAPVP